MQIPTQDDGLQKDIFRRRIATHKRSLRDENLFPLTFRGFQPTATMISHYATHATMPPNFKLQTEYFKLNPILRDLHPLAVFERGLVSNDAGERYVECVAHVDNRLLIQQDRLNKIIGELSV